MNPNILVGMDGSDDAGVLRLSHDLCLVQTADFITPVVDDPYQFGCIAAANSLSDVYAMGGTPISALNLVCYDSCNLEPADLQQILQGGLDTAAKAGATVLGGHTVEAPEMKYGLAVTGIVPENRIVRNVGARPGDLLVLTKPLGIGIIATANKADMSPDDAMAQATRLMMTLNDRAARLMVEFNAHGATDITGFGLVGHALEMVGNGDITFDFYMKEIPYLHASLELASMGLIPGGAYSNRQHAGERVLFPEDVSDDLKMIFFDPQTSGGLLIALPPETAPAFITAFNADSDIEACIVGTVTPRQDVRIRFS